MKNYFLLSISLASCAAYGSWERDNGDVLGAPNGDRFYPFGDSGEANSAPVSRENRTVGDIAQELLRKVAQPKQVYAYVSQNCPTCNKTFWRAADEKTHVCAKNPYTCRCGVGCTNANSLSWHIEACKSAQKPAAQILGVRPRGHPREKPYRCPVLRCRRAFAENETLKEHMRTHTGEKPHICLSCGKRFSDPSNRNAHMRNHGAKKPFKCPDCGKGFTRKSNMFKHAKVHSYLQAADALVLLAQDDQAE